MRHQVTINRPSASVDDRGRPTGSPSTVLANVPCEIKQLSGLELIRAQKVHAEATYKVEMNGDPSNPVKPTDHFAFGSRTLQIGSVVDGNQTGERLVLLCKEAL